MRGSLHFVCVGGFLGLLAPAMPGADPPDLESLAQDPHVREELGVNEYTTPLIAGVFRDLDDFDPARLAALSRGPSGRNFPQRAQLALNLGQTIAEGFVAAASKDQASIEKVARALIRQGEALAVSQPLKKRGQSLLELSVKGNWTELRAELTAAQNDVERVLMNLRDEEVAHLIGLGGWLRGLEITSRLTAEAYTRERSQNLDRAGLVDYFCDRVSTLSPRIRELPLFRQIDARLGEIRRILLPEGPPDAGEVARMATITRELNEAIAKPID